MSSKMCKCIRSDVVERTPAKQASTMPGIHDVRRLLTTCPAGNASRMELSSSAFEGLKLGKFPGLGARPSGCPWVRERKHEQNTYSQGLPVAIEVLKGAPHIERSRRPPRLHMHGRITSGGAFSVIEGKDTARANDRTSQARSQKGVGVEVEVEAGKGPALACTLSKRHRANRQRGPPPPPK